MSNQEKNENDVDDDKNNDNESTQKKVEKKPEELVNSFTEWDPLEEVIVGHPGEATVLKLAHEGNLEDWLRTFPDSMRDEWRKDWNNFKLHSPVSQNYLRRVLYQRDNFKKILSSFHVKIHDAEDIKWTDIKYSLPFTKNKVGANGWNPRDLLLPAGNTIIQSPLIYEEREYEWLAYRKIMYSLIKQGGRWIVSPAITRTYDTYNELVKSFSVYDYNSYETNIVKKKPYLWAVAEEEPCWEAADILRCGKDYFIQQSHVTNNLGIKWVTTTLNDLGFRVHRIKFQNEYNPVHIDTSITALRAGLAIYDSSRPLDKKCETIFKKSGWKLVPIPAQKFEKGHSYGKHWYFSLNLLSINETDLICDKYMGEHLKSLGFRPQIIDYSLGLPLMGGPHCNTCDIKRRGYQRSYFSYLDQQDEQKKKKKSSKL